MHARGFQQIEKLSSCYRVEANLDGSRICRESIDQTESFSMDQESIEKLSRQRPETSINRVCDNLCRERKSKGLDR